jgi:hypothetical protein
VIVALRDGYRPFVEEVGDGFPLVVLHGVPGVDQTMFRPYLDPLAGDLPAALRRRAWPGAKRPSSAPPPRT